jgi:hypothetical protein
MRTRRESIPGPAGAIECAIDDPPEGAAPARGVAQRVDFGMSGGVAGADGAIPTLPHHLSVRNQDGRNRDFSGRRRPCGKRQRPAHPVFIGREIGGFHVGGW